MIREHLFCSVNYMNKLIKHYENVALSNQDIFKKVHGRVNIEVYPNLYKYRSIDELLGPYGACILLFESKPSYGHWVLIFKLSNSKLEFFNPYGGYPDDTLLYIDDSFRKKTRQLKPRLSLLMLNSPYELSYNEFAFQKHKGDIKTCGRHCIVRLLCRNYNLYEYKALLDRLSKQYKMNYDEIVTALTV